MTTTDAPSKGIDLEAIRVRADAATPGPWRTNPDAALRLGDELHEYVYAAEPTDRHGIVALTGIKGEHVRNPRDAKFIAHARTDVPALLAEINRLRRIVKEVIDLTRSTDGDFLQPESEIPVGEIQRVLYDTGSTA